MNRRCLVVLICLCAACSPARYMTYDAYKEVTIGEQIVHVQALVGKPYEIKELGPDTKEYIYIERIAIGDARELFRRYILVVERGYVIDKKVQEETTPAFQYYD